MPAIARYILMKPVLAGYHWLCTAVGLYVNWCTMYIKTYFYIKGSNLLLYQISAKVTTHSQHTVMGWHTHRQIVVVMVTRPQCHVFIPDREIWSIYCYLCHWPRNICCFDILGQGTFFFNTQVISKSCDSDLKVRPIHRSLLLTIWTCILAVVLLYCCYFSPKICLPWTNTHFQCLKIETSEVIT